MRKQFVAASVLLAAPLVACGALLGSSSDDIEPPDRGIDAGRGSRGEAGDEESGVDASTDADGANGDGADAVADATVDAAAPRDKVVFVTSERYAGGFGTRADADALCTFLAKQANAAKFGGSTFKAYLAASNGAPASARITDRVYVRIDGAKVFDPGPQTMKTPSNVVAIDEKGNDLSLDGNKFVWTGHANGVMAVDRTCGDWTSGAGTKFGGFGDLHTTATWGTSAGATAGCDQLLRLYCFED